MNNLRNSVQLIGHLGMNPELIEIEGGKKLAKVSIATKDIYQTEGEKIVKTEWHNIVAWGKIAEQMDIFLNKGNEVVFRGKLQHRSYEDKEGQKRFISEILVREFTLLNKATPSYEG